MTVLEREWEMRLESEGMGARLSRASTQALTNANTDIPCAAYAESPRLERWTQLTHMVNSLPLGFHNRHLLVTFCETGYASKTALRHRVSRFTVYRAIKSLNQWIQHAKGIP